MPLFSKTQRSAAEAKAPSDQPSRPSFTTTSEVCARDLCWDSIGEQDIQAFLADNCEYDDEEKRWSTLDAMSSEEDLLGSLFKIVMSIVRRFVGSIGDGLGSEVVETHSGKASILRSPSVAIRAAGPSFKLSQSRDSHIPLKDPRKTVGFSNIVSYISVKKDSVAGSTQENVDEMEAYARQIFSHQPNRCIFRSLVLTEKHARLVQFDRAGAQATPLIDIHRDVIVFIRLITGLFSTAEHILGIDDNIQWTVIDGKEEKGTLTMRVSDYEDTAYQNFERVPVPQDPMPGRATICWSVQHTDTHEELVIKDTWQPVDHPGKYEPPGAVKGDPGAQMVSPKAPRQTTKDFCSPTSTRSSQYSGRIPTRTSMKVYGKPIYSFTSMRQVCCALREAIAAHQRLVDDHIGVLHRDISHNNVLLGRDSAPVGERGVLVDLDLAFRGTDEQPKIKGDLNIGARVFQSLSVLEGFALKSRTAEHDYLSDLESFFFILCYILLTFTPHGSRLPIEDKGPSLVLSWGDPDPQRAFALKEPIFAIGSDSIAAFDIVELNWGTIALQLFKSFRKWTSDVGMEKTKLVYKDMRRPTPNPLSCLHARREEHYSEVLAIFDQAIGQLEGESASPVTHRLEHHSTARSPATLSAS